MKQEFVVLESKKNVTLFFILIFSLGLGIRFWYFPLDVPIAGDGFFSFIYSMKTVFDGQEAPAAEELARNRFIAEFSCRDVAGERRPTKGADRGLGERGQTQS